MLAPLNAKESDVAKTRHVILLHLIILQKLFCFEKIIRSVEAFSLPTKRTHVSMKCKKYHNVCNAYENHISYIYEVRIIYI